MTVPSTEEPPVTLVEDRVTLWRLAGGGGGGGGVTVRVALRLTPV